MPVELLELTLPMEPTPSLPTVIIVACRPTSISGHFGSIWITLDVSHYITVVSQYQLLCKYNYNLIVCDNILFVVKGAYSLTLSARLGLLSYGYWHYTPNDSDRTGQNSIRNRGNLFGSRKSVGMRGSRPLSNWIFQLYDWVRQNCWDLSARKLSPFK